MNFRKITAAVIAAAAIFTPITSGSISPLIPSSVRAEEYSQGAALPDWIPYDYDTALSFRNTYGATHIENGLVCVVFREKYDKDPEGELRYEVNTTKGMMKELKHDIYSSDDSEYCYEVVVYFSPQDKGEFDVMLVDTWSDSVNIPTDTPTLDISAVYTFLIGEDNSITQTDIFSWLPDSITEYKEYVTSCGKVSSKDEFVIFCLDSNAGTPYKWSENLQEKHLNFMRYKKADCSMETAVAPDGGALNHIEVYKAINNGKSKIKWDYIPSDGFGEISAVKTLIADCNVTDDMNVTLDNAYIQDVPFKATQISLYSGDLTVSSSEVYSRFSDPQPVVITSNRELTFLLGFYLNEKALNNFVSQYSDDFFNDNVLILNTYLDPYRGRVFKHGLDSVYYKDDKLIVDSTAVVSSPLMRTSYFSILQLEVPKKYYNVGYDLVWNFREVLNYDLKRISVIDEDTGENIAIPADNVLDLFGNRMKYLEGSNPYFWDTEFYTGDWRELSVDEKFLPGYYELADDSTKEIKQYDFDSADIIFKVKQKKPIEVKYAADKFSTITPGLFSEEIKESPELVPAVATSTEELSDILSLYISEEYQNKYYSVYNDEFFSNNVLLLNFASDSTGGDKVEINSSSITADNITVYYSKPSTEFNICNTSYFFILQAAVPKDSYIGQKTQWKCMGDTNGDGDFGIADLVTLQNWLLSGSRIKLYDRKTADLCEDNVIDAFDLIAMRKMLINIHGLEKNVSYEINTQTFRSSKGSVGSKIAIVTMITNQKELQSYFTPNFYYNDLEKYNDEWFSDHKLMVINVEETSGSIGHELISLTNSYATVNRLIPEVMSCDMASWDILAELDKNAEISNDFRVNFKDTYVH